MWISLFFTIGLIDCVFSVLFPSMLGFTLTHSRLGAFAGTSKSFRLSTKPSLLSISSGGFRLYSSSGYPNNVNVSTTHGSHNKTSPLSTQQRIDKLAAAIKLSSDKETVAKLYETSVLANNSLIAHLNKVYCGNHNAYPEYLNLLLDLSIDLLRSYPNVIAANLHRNASSGDMEGHLNICGDTHGQYDDFTEIFMDKVGGFPSETNRFVFNGDIADRGPKAIEIFTTLLTMKLVNPDAIHILRGNHESEQMTSRFGFRDEVMRKYGLPMLQKFYQLFISLPVAAVVEKDIFVVHGGLGPKSFNLTVAELNKIDRITEDDDVIDELLWADPRDEVETFETNHARGGGILFGPRVTNHFLAKNNFGLLVRSHEMQDHGLSVMHNQRCITVFSAPNYCGVCKNKGAILRLSKAATAVTTPPSDNNNNSENGTSNSDSNSNNSSDNSSAKQTKPSLQLAAIQFDAKIVPRARK